jgi:hypothetical protein
MADDASNGPIGTAATPRAEGGRYPGAPPPPSRCRLSESVLWRWQRNYFQRRGIRAWSRGEVPHHVTSCPYIAEAYSRVVLGFLRDCLTAPAGGDRSEARPIDPDRPLYVIELGSGPGRFAYLFLKALRGLRRNPPFHDLSIRYVLTDFAERSLDYLHAHPRLRPFFEAGELDLARFDVESDRELALLRSGDVLGPGTLTNPLVVIANYLFDSIPQDAFAIAEGRLYELLLTIAPAAEPLDADDTALLAGAELTYEAEAVDGPYYGDPSWDRLLDGYRRRLPETTFLFPTAALRCIRNLVDFSSAPMLLLSGDRGYSRDEALAMGQGIPHPTLHGSFSLRVDYQLLGEYCRNQGGRALHPDHRHGDLHISALIFGASPGAFYETRQAYADAVERFGPDDFWTLRKGVEKAYDALSPDEVLALLRLSGWDHRRLIACLPALKPKLATLSAAQREGWVEAVCRVWDHYFPIGEEDDLAFEIGAILQGMGHHIEALTFFRHSVDLHGMKSATAFKIAACHLALRRREARRWVEKALALSPDREHWGKEVESERSGRLGWDGRPRRRPGPSVLGIGVAAVAGPGPARACPTSGPTAPGPAGPPPGPARFGSSGPSRSAVRGPRPGRARSDSVASVPLW